ncbi:MAG TPA: dihydropteroate synthase [Verrucomicrobiota bacterium]|nr:dihydropteroate synthase [Verrucomicrobiales bacterium]HRI11718.1 dihydropteroate synthase [Verrucomicrobiota bacterium]
MLTLEQLAELAQGHAAAITARVTAFELGGRRFDGNHAPEIMGVINLSADSWYRESVCRSAEAAIRRGRVLAAQGAAMIDVGAESSLANADRVGDLAQTSRLLPIVRELSAEGLIVSVETYHTSVTRTCFEAGARVLNLTGSEATEDMFRVVADHDGAVIICYVQGRNVREVADFDLAADSTVMLYEYFARQIELATRLGIRRLWIDPGLGFYYRNLQDSAVRIRHQIQVFLHTFRLRTLGWPTCHALPHAAECFGEEVRCAEPFFAVLAALGKTDLFRTHEVPRIKAVLDTLALAR